jgi:hypothetical protein
LVVIQDNDSDRLRTIIIVVIEADNLRRMENADPLTLNPLRFGGLLYPVMYPANLQIVIAYEPQAGELYRMIENGASARTIREYVERGYTFTNVDGKMADPRKKGAS